MLKQSRSRNTLVHCPFLHPHQRDKPSRDCIEPLQDPVAQPSATNERPRRYLFRHRSLGCKPVRGCIGRIPILCFLSSMLRHLFQASTVPTMNAKGASKNRHTKNPWKSFIECVSY